MQKLIDTDQLFMLLRSDVGILRLWDKKLDKIKTISLSLYQNHTRKANKHKNRVWTLVSNVTFLSKAIKWGRIHNSDYNPIYVFFKSMHK